MPSASRSAVPRIENAHVVTPDGVPLLVRRLGAEGAARGVALMTSTIAQHVGNLEATMRGLARQGWDVVAADLRGHGGSAGPRAPLAHMEPGRGWDRLVADFRQVAEHAFAGVTRDRRLVIAANIGASLCLEVLKEQPDLARHVVLSAPPPNQPALMRFARAMTRARMVLSDPERPDELTMHQLYTFLGGQLGQRRKAIDVVSADPQVIAELEADPLSWPTPTLGYFSEMFRGTERAWAWSDGQRVAGDTRFLVLYGGDDAVTARGAYVAGMRRALEALGAGAVEVQRVEGGRSGLIIDERSLGISERIAAWHDTARDGGSAEADGGAGAMTTGPGEDLASVASSVLSRLGAETRPLRPDELVELCYTAIGDDRRWIELLYRLAHTVSLEASPQASDDLLAVLAPHYDRALQIDRQIMEAAAVGTVLQEMLDRLGIGLAIVTPDLEVRFANAGFAGWLGIGPEGRAPERLTPALKARVGAGFAEAVRGGGDTVPLMEGEEIAGVHFRPAALRQTALDRGGSSGVIAIRRAGREDRAMIELLQVAHGLTEREAEVVRHLCRGLSPDSIATVMGVSVHTTRTHLKHAFDKTGTAGQTELVALVMTGPLGLFGA